MPVAPQWQPVRLTVLGCEHSVPNAFMYFLAGLEHTAQQMLGPYSKLYVPLQLRPLSSLCVSSGEDYLLSWRVPQP